VTLGPLANLLWLLPAVGRQRLLVVQGGTSVLAPAITPLFVELVVANVDAPAWRAVPAALEMCPAVQVDAVLVDLDTATPANPARLSDALAAIRQKLASSHGALIVRQRGRLRGWRGSRRAALEQRMREAGFRDVRGYYVAPHAEHPLVLLPAYAPAVLAWDAIRPKASLRHAARTVVARSGLHELLFDETLVVART
jgi:hypothetical protein